jgi:hypothetical protein
VDTVTILRRLWRFRPLVAVIGVFALAAGLLVSFKLPSLESRKYEVGVATARILVDTPASQVVDVAPAGSDTLGVRATLLSNLMVDGVVKAAIAKRAGLEESQLYGVSEAGAGPPGETKPDPRGYALETKVLITSKGDPLPIIELATQAPDAAGAEKLATAAIDGLLDYLKTKAVSERVGDGERLRVSGLGVPQARLEVRGPPPIFSLGAAVFVFALGCALIVMIDGLVRELRAPPKTRGARSQSDDFDARRVQEEEFWSDEEAAQSAGSREAERPAVSLVPPPPDAPAASRSSGSWFGGGPSGG